MTTAAVELVKPAHLWVPPHRSTAGPDVLELAADIGLGVDPEQALALDVIFAELDGGIWACLEAAVVAARQNLKSYLFQLAVLGHLFLFDAQLVIWSAHLFSTAQEAFRNIDAIIAGSPDLSRRIKRIDKANGDEGFELDDGRRLKFRARSKTGGRGLTGDVVVLDEAFALTAAEVGSLLPTLSSRPNPQVIYGSSAGLLTSEILRGIRDRGRAGAADPTNGDDGLGWLEWCAPTTRQGPDGEPLPLCEDDRCDHRYGSDGCALDDFDLIRQANPALDRRITRRFILTERRILPPVEFARERLGWWEDPIAGDSGIDADLWAAHGDRTADLDEPVALAFDVAPGHTSAAIAACGGPLHIAKAGRGTAWVVAELLDLKATHKLVGPIGLDPAGPAGALIPDLDKAGIEYVALDGREQTAACELFLAGIVEENGDLIHRDEIALNTAVAGAGRRQVGDSWKWSRRDSAVDISPLVAATVALWLYLQHRPEPPSSEPYFDFT